MQTCCSYTDFIYYGLHSLLGPEMAFVLVTFMHSHKVTSLLVSAVNLVFCAN